MNETKSVTFSPNLPSAKPTDRLQALPTFMQRQILAFFGYQEYTLTGRTCHYLHARWTEAMQRHRMTGTLFVPIENCKTLKKAVKQVHGDDRLTTIVLGKGEHVVAVYKDEDGDDSNDLVISSAMNIVGDPGVLKSEIVVVGGIKFKPGIQGNCHLQHLTLRQAKQCGVYGQSSFTMEDVLVEQCGYYGVVASGTGVVGRCTNVEVRQCGMSGVIAWNGASITLIGPKTTVHHNCTKGDSGSYGLEVYGSSSSTIQLVFPLTKEEVAVDNGGGGNWGAGGGGDIHQIKTISPTVTASDTTTNNNSNGRRDVLRTLPTFMQRQILAFFGYQDYTLTGRTCQYLHALWKKAVDNKQLPLFVPVDCKTLKEAVERVKRDHRLTTIVVGKGEHQIDGKNLQIASTMHIVGDPGVPKEEIVVVGGIWFKRGRNCHLQHLTLRQAKWSGVQGSSSFTMDDVLVEQCGGDGVGAYGTGVFGRCTNVEVRQCGYSGVAASRGASITLIGAKTTVHHNCTKGNSADNGLKVYGSSSTIQLISPLTKERVAIDNGGGGNWGAGPGGDINQIKTIAATVVLYRQQVEKK
jgi:hypothetical protein